MVDVADELTADNSVQKNKPVKNIKSKRITRPITNFFNQECAGVPRHFRRESSGGWFQAINNQTYRSKGCAPSRLGRISSSTAGAIIPGLLLRPGNLFCNKYNYLSGVADRGCYIWLALSRSRIHGSSVRYMGHSLWSYRPNRLRATPLWGSWVRLPFLKTAKTLTILESASMEHSTSICAACVIRTF